MRYAMTGATGFLGGELARQLRTSGHDVVALVRDPAKADRLRDLGVELVDGDLHDAGALDRLLEGADGFFHVAGWYKMGRRELDAMRRGNVEGTRNALEAAKRAQVPRTVYTSTIALNGDTHGARRDESYHHEGPWNTAYDHTKWEAHQVAKEYAADGLPLVILQPSTIYGPGDTGSVIGQLTRQLMRGRPVLGPGRYAGLAWAHVEDVARGHVLAMEKGRLGESYILAGEPIPIADMLRLVKQVSGSRAPLLLVPRPALRAMAAMTWPVERFVRLPQGLTADAARSATSTYYGDSSKAERELGWTSRPAREGIAEMVRTELAAAGRG